MRPHIWPVLSLLAFCLLFLALTKLLLAGSFEAFVYSWDAPIYLFLFSVMSVVVTRAMKRWLERRTRRVTADGQYAVLFVASTTLCATLAAALSVSAEAWMLGKAHTAYHYVVLWLLYFTFLAMVINTYIATQYLRDVGRMRETLLLAERAQVETQLKLLQQKVDPHFLFNNLNVLSALVERSPGAAREFVTHFTRLYRYILQHLDAEIVPLDEELAFARDYVYLVEQRFGRAYRFALSPAGDRAGDRLIIPTALQGLIENAVKHNEGSAAEPLDIAIDLTGDYLTVRNQRRPKSEASPTSGTGLENLQARYRLLTDRPVEIRRGDEDFTVRVPLLTVVNT